MICLRLLFTRLYLVDGTCLQSLTLLFLLSQVVEITLIVLFRKGQPVHHISGIMNLEERLYLTVNGVFHLCGKGEMEGLASDRLQLVGDIL